MYGEKSVRIPLDLHRPCPHRVENNGCTYCLPESFVPTATSEEGSLLDQLTRGADRARKKYHAYKFIAYFQAGTNTAGTVEECEKAYTTAAHFPGVVAVSISTRPDYLDKEICDVITRLTREIDVWIELGVQTLNDATLQRINRGHTAECALHAINQVKELGVKHVVAHMILGLPGDSQADMHKSMKGVIDAGADGIKIHHLHVVRNTPMEEEWEKGMIKVFTENEYIDCVIDILEHIPDNIVIHRLVGAAPDALLVAPRWESSTQQIVQKIQKEMTARETRQGNQSAIPPCGKK